MARATPLSVLYCDCGPATRPLWGTRWPSPDEVAQGVRRALARLPAPPRWITLSGEGHPRFGVVIDRLLAARDALAPDAGVAILSNRVPREARVDAETFDAWRQLVVQEAPEGVRIYAWRGVPRERLEEMGRALRDALPDVIVEVL